MEIAGGSALRRCGTVGGLDGMGEHCAAMGCEF